MEMCHNNIIIEHRSFRWVEVATRNGVGLPDKGECDNLIKLRNESNNPICREQKKFWYKKSA